MWRRAPTAKCVAKSLALPPWRLLPLSPSSSRATPLVVTTHAYGTRSNTTATSSSSDYYNQQKEDEEDKVLEDEEFAALRDADDSEFMPLAHRLAHKADALDAELHRLRHVLCAHPQFLVDSAPATLSGRPTSVQRVLGILQGNGEMGDGGAPTPAGRSAKAVHALSASMESALRASPYASWKGASDPAVRFLSQRLLWRSSSTAASAQGSAELATLDANLDYLRRARALHQLNYYSRLNLTPKRHIWLALYQIVWNVFIAAQNACGCVVYGVLRGMKEHGAVKGACVGLLSGTGKALAFLAYGWVLSPWLHLTRGIANTVYGPLNAVRGQYMFDALSGRWMRCTVADTRLFRHELQREKRVLRTIGRAEFRRKRMKVEHKWADRMASMGFSVDMMKERFMPGSPNTKGTSAGKAEEKLRSPYEVLQVRRTASAQEVKKQYKKLAMVFHPDVAQSRKGGTLTAEEKAEAQHKFEEISNAYQILSNAEKRKAYDMGGAQGVRMHETKFGKFMSRTPAEMVQSVFGGEGFRRLLVGELLRSHWALRYESQISVSLHELEELQCIRVRQLAMELAAIADVHAQRPTTPYHGSGSKDGPASAGTTHTSHRGSSSSTAYSRNRSSSSSSSSLPDYLKSGKLRTTGPGVSSAAARHATAAGATDGRHAGKGVEKEVRESIMEELGGAGGAAGGSASASSHLGSRRGTPDTTSASATASSSSSPFALHPGSNEYNCFSRDFEDRCDKLVRHLADACFGKQLLYEVGEAYVTSAQRFLHIRPFYASKWLVTRKIFSGMDRVYDAFQDKTRLNSQQVSQKMMAEYFNMEYDSVVADVHVALRYALQIVLQDCVESEEVRRKRCYAVWLLGEKMMASGERWTARLAKDDDLVAYIQQAATSVATTSKPPAF